MKKIIILIILLIIANQAMAKNYHIKWKEKNSKIMYDSVCYNQKKNFDKAGCRKQAKKYFKKMCKRTNSKKFCEAGKEYRPNYHGKMSFISN